MMDETPPPSPTVNPRVYENVTDGFLCYGPPSSSHEISDLKGLVRRSELKQFYESDQNETDKEPNFVTVFGRKILVSSLLTDQVSLNLFIKGVFALETRSQTPHIEAEIQNYLKCLRRISNEEDFSDQALFTIFSIFPSIRDMSSRMSKEDPLYKIIFHALLEVRYTVLFLYMKFKSKRPLSSGPQYFISPCEESYNKDRGVNLLFHLASELIYLFSLNTHSYETFSCGCIQELWILIFEWVKLEKLVSFWPFIISRFNKQSQRVVETRTVGNFSYEPVELRSDVFWRLMRELIILKKSVEPLEEYLPINLPLESCLLSLESNFKPQIFKPILATVFEVRSQKYGIDAFCSIMKFVLKNIDQPALSNSSIYDIQVLLPTTAESWKYTLENNLQDSANCSDSFVNFLALFSSVNATHKHIYGRMLSLLTPQKLRNVNELGLFRILNIILVLAMTSKSGGEKAYVHILPLLKPITESTLNPPESYRAVLLSLGVLFLCSGGSDEVFNDLNSRLEILLAKSKNSIRERSLMPMCVGLYCELIHSLPNKFVRSPTFLIKYIKQTEETQLIGQILRALIQFIKSNSSVSESDWSIGLMQYLRREIVPSQKSLSIETELAEYFVLNVLLKKKSNETIREYVAFLGSSPLVSAKLSLRFLTKLLLDLKEDLVVHDKPLLLSVCQGYFRCSIHIDSDECNLISLQSHLSQILQLNYCGAEEKESSINTFIQSLGSSRNKSLRTFYREFFKPFINMLNEEFSQWTKNYRVVYSVGGWSIKYCYHILYQQGESNNYLNIIIQKLYIQPRVLKIAESSSDFHYSLKKSLSDVLSGLARIFSPEKDRYTARVMDEIIRAHLFRYILSDSPPLKFITNMRDTSLNLKTANILLSALNDKNFIQKSSLIFSIIDYFVKEGSSRLIANFRNTLFCPLLYKYFDRKEGHRQDILNALLCLLEKANEDENFSSFLVKFNDVVISKIAYDYKDAFIFLKEINKTGLSSLVKSLLPEIERNVAVLEKSRGGGVGQMRAYLTELKKSI